MEVDDVKKELIFFIKEVIASSFVGVVEDISKAESEGLVTVLFDDVKRSVRLKSVVGSSQELLVVPQKDSYVFCVAEGHDSDSYLVVKVSAVDKIVFNGNSVNAVLDDVNDKVSLDASEVVFNGGGNNGMVKVGDLVAKLNSLENDINSLKSVFRSWVPASQDGGAVLKTESATWASQSITPTQQGDLENEKIKH